MDQPGESDKTKFCFPDKKVEGEEFRVQSSEFREREKGGRTCSPIIVIMITISLLFPNS